MLNRAIFRGELMGGVLASLRWIFNAHFCAAFSLVLLLCNSPLARAQTDDPPIEGPAYAAADEAYSAFKAGDFSRAAQKARESIALRPDLLRLRLLLVDSLLAANDINGA